MARIEVQKARFRNRIDNKGNWQTAGDKDYLYPGEFGIVTSNDGTPQFMMVGKANTPPSDIVNNPSTNDKFIFYPGRGANFNTIATEDTLGGVKIPTDEESALVMTRSTYASSDDPLDTLRISSLLISDWDKDLKCFVVPRLYVKDLHFEKQTENPVFESDSITLRNDPEGGSTEALGDDEYSGIIVNKPAGGADGFFGINNEYFLHVRRDDFYYTIPMYNRSNITEGLGFFSIDKTTNQITVSRPTTLTVNRGMVSESYNGIDSDLIINYPSITLNNQKLSYDSTTNMYSGNFDGGLTESNALLISQIPNKLDKNNLINGTGIVIDNTRLDGKTSISHTSYKTVESPTTDIEGLYDDSIEPITISAKQGGTITAITEIAVENGHITKITRQVFNITE